MNFYIFNYTLQKKNEKSVPENTDFSLYIRVYNHQNWHWFFYDFFRFSEPVFIFPSLNRLLSHYVLAATEQSTRDNFHRIVHAACYQMTPDFVDLRLKLTSQLEVKLNK